MACKCTHLGDLDSMTVICENTVMVVQGHDAYTLDELLAEVARLVGTLGLTGSQKDNRVSQLPDVRTVRYYTSLGLLDRPQIVGRQGVYGRRHVLQLLAIKAMQSLSLPLQEIQTRLYGLSDTELDSLSQAISRQIAQIESTLPITRTVIWREITVQPGLKLMVEDGWKPETDVESSLSLIRATLDSLSK